MTENSTSKHKIIIALAVVLYITMTGMWTLLAAAQWSTLAVALSLAPLLIALACMLKTSPKIYFYAALLSMPYIATAMTQIMISSESRAYAIACLACALAYLAILKFTLRALHHGNNKDLT